MPRMLSLCTDTKVATRSEQTQSLVGGPMYSDLAILEARFQAVLSEWDETQIQDEKKHLVNAGPKPRKKNNK